MRILHMIDQASSQACATTMALLAHAMQAAGCEPHQLLLLGGAPLAREAASAGLICPTVRGMPLGRAILGAASLHHWKRHQPHPPHLIHCWSIGALTAATLLWRQVPKLLTLTTIPTQKQVRWLNQLVVESAAGTQLLCCSASIQQALRQGGLAPDRVHVLRPGLNLGRLRQSNRQVLRDQWKLQNPDAQVVMLLSDPPHEADATAAAMVLGLAAVAMQKTNLYLLVHPDQYQRLRAVNVMRPLEGGHLILADPKVNCPWEVLPGCDVAMALDHPGGGGLSLLWAMAGGVPLIAEATHTLSEILEDRHSALLAPPRQPRLLAGRLQRVLTEPQLAWQLHDTARHEAYSFFSRQRFIRNQKRIYENVLAHEPIQIPDLPLTGGLRFAGHG